MTEYAQPQSPLCHWDCTPEQAKRYLEGIIACEVQLRREVTAIQSKINQLVRLADAYGRLAHPPKRIEAADVSAQRKREAALNKISRMSPRRLAELIEQAEKAAT